MFQSLANFQPFQSSISPNKQVAGQQPAQSFQVQNVQPENDGGPLTSTLVNKGYQAGQKMATKALGGSADEMHDQVIKQAADMGNPIAQSALNPAQDSSANSGVNGAGNSSAGAMKSSLTPDMGGQVQDGGSSLMKSADPTNSDGAKGWFDGMMNFMNTPSTSAGAASSPAGAGAASGGGAVDSAAGGAAGDASSGAAADEGAADAAGAADSGSSMASILDWL